MVKTGVSDLMYRSHVTEIFNVLFIEKHTNINRKNVVFIEHRLKFILSYFKQWNSKKLKEKPTK